MLQSLPTRKWYLFMQIVFDDFLALLADTAEYFLKFAAWIESNFVGFGISYIQ